MLKFFSKLINNKKGFTLIELIVVIAILAVLALIAIPRVGKFRTQAAISSHNANVRTLESAASMCLAENGVPTTDNVTWGKENPGTGEHLWAGYIAAWPEVPKGAQGQALAVGEDTIGESYTVTIAKDTGVVTVSPGLGKTDE